MYKMLTAMTQACRCTMFLNDWCPGRGPETASPTCMAAHHRRQAQPKPRLHRGSKGWNRTILGCCRSPWWRSKMAIVTYNHQVAHQDYKSRLAHQDCTTRLYSQWHIKIANHDWYPTIGASRLYNTIIHTGGTLILHNMNMLSVGPFVGTIHNSPCVQWSMQNSPKAQLRIGRLNFATATNSIRNGSNHNFAK